MMLIHGQNLKDQESGKIYAPVPVDHYAILSAPAVFLDKILPMKKSSTFPENYSVYQDQYKQKLLWFNA